MKQGKRITITDRGTEVARVVPLEEQAEGALQQKIADLRAAGILGPPATRSFREVVPGPARPGALERFLRERD